MTTQSFVTRAELASPVTTRVRVAAVSSTSAKFGCRLRLARVLEDWRAWTTYSAGLGTSGRYRDQRAADTNFASGII